MGDQSRSVMSWSEDETCHFDLLTITDLPLLKLWILLTDSLK